MPVVDYSGLTPPKAATAAFMFYDIESLHNVFTFVAYNSTNSNIYVFFQLDEDTLTGVTSQQVTVTLQQRISDIAEKNPAWVRRAKQRGHRNPQVFIRDLANDENVRMLDRITGGVLTNTRTDVHAGARSEITDELIICDTNPNYDPNRHPFIAGYNSNQYDTTILALYFEERWTTNGFAPVSAATMRSHNDSMFALVKPGDPSIDKQPMTRYLSNDHTRARAIRTNWINTGRHVDLARLNELQARVALKRLLGMLGHQILESDKLAGPGAQVETIEDIIDLITYNISDTVGNALLTEHPVYAGSFDLRAGLLRTYPEVVFNHKHGDPRTPNQHTSSVLKDWPRHRLTVDSSSAQFAGRILAPYRSLRDIPGHVADLPVVSYRYPDPLNRAKDPSHRPVNVLSEARDFFFESVPPTTPANLKAHKAFEQVYRYYRSIEGLTFTSDENEKRSPLPMIGAARGLVQKLAELQPELSVSHTFVKNGSRVLVTDTASRLNQGFITLLGAGTQVQKISNPQEVFDLLVMIDELVDLAHFVTERERAEAKAVMLNLTVILQAWVDSNEPYWPNSPIPPLVIDHEPWAWRNRVHALSDVAKPALNMPYFASDGTPSSGFVTFSYGGIHGAEVNQQLLEADSAASNQAWRLFHAAIDAALLDWPLACARVDADEPKSKREATAVPAGREWIPIAEANQDPDTRLPDLERPDGTLYTKHELAIAAWWLRKSVRVETALVDDDGQPIVVEWDHVLKSTAKSNFPVIREYPKGLRNAGPSIFTSETTTAIPAGPPTEDGSDPVHTGNKLDSRYKYTSVNDVIHEDFTSYYPLLLVRLGAFTNPDLAAPGEPPRDKYSEIFDDKENYGRLMKDPGIDAATKAQYSVLRNGVKLILNAASGAADARHDTPILMNNMIITMRIIGQLFSWRIGQAQTAAGGTIVSTNTDGLYSTLDEKTNNEVLAQHTDAIGVQIEPEPLTLVSKDANNRVEFFTPADSAKIVAKAQAKSDPSAPATTAADVQARPSLRQIVSAGGGTLACWEGPSPTKALAHSAIIDRILVEYFKYTASGHPRAGISDPMDPDLVHVIIADLKSQLSAREMLRLYQNLLASSPSAPSYIYAVPYRRNQQGEPIPATDSAGLTFPGDNRPELDEIVDPRSARYPGAVEPRLLGHYTRVFTADPDKIDARLAKLVGTPVVLGAAKAATLSDQRIEVIRDRGEANPYNQVAAYLLAQAGEQVARLRSSRAITLAKHSGVDPTEPMMVFNDTIIDHPDEEVIRALLDAVDEQAYVSTAIEAFDKNWRNISA